MDQLQEGNKKGGELFKPNVVLSCSDSPLGAADCTRLGASAVGYSQDRTLPQKHTRALNYSFQA